MLLVHDSRKPPITHAYYRAYLVGLGELGTHVGLDASARLPGRSFLPPIRLFLPLYLFPVDLVTFIRYSSLVGLFDGILQRTSIG